jgi:hypothetical protein
VEPIALNPEQQAAVRQVMVAIVERDEAAVADLLDRSDYPETVYAAPAANFWMWADNYADERLHLVLPPGDVADWGVWGFPLRDRQEVLALHVDVWANWGRTDLTIQFDLAPEGDGYRIRLHDMHVM